MQRIGGITGKQAAPLLQRLGTRALQRYRETLADALDQSQAEAEAVL